MTSHIYLRNPEYQSRRNYGAKMEKAPQTTLHKDNSLDFVKGDYILYQVPETPRNYHNIPGNGVLQRTPE